MALVKVWLCGEGSCEIGNRDQWEGRRSGVLEALLLRVAPEGWTVLGATRWSSLRKYVAKAPLDKADKRGHADEKNVKGLLYEARRRGADVVAFLRDVDNHEERVQIIHRGIEGATSLSGTQAVLQIIAGFPRPNLEGWILALSKVNDTDDMSRDRAKSELAAREISDRNVEEYVSLVESADLEKLPGGSASLSSWLKCAKDEMSNAIQR